MRNEIERLKNCLAQSVGDCASGETRDRTSAISSSHLHVSRLKPDGSLLTQEAVQAMQAANHLLMQGYTA